MRILIHSPAYRPVNHPYNQSPNSRSEKWRLENNRKSFVQHEMYFLILFFAQWPERSWLIDCNTKFCFSPYFSSIFSAQAAGGQGGQAEGVQGGLCRHRRSRGRYEGGSPGLADQGTVRYLCATTLSGNWLRGRLGHGFILLPVQVQILSKFLFVHI